MYMRHRITQTLVMLSSLLSLLHVIVLHIAGLVLHCIVLTTLLKDTPHHILHLSPGHNLVCWCLYSLWRLF